MHFIFLDLSIVGIKLRIPGNLINVKEYHCIIQIPNKHDKLKYIYAGDAFPLSFSVFSNSMRYRKRTTACSNSSGVGMLTIMR